MNNNKMPRARVNLGGTTEPKTKRVDTNVTPKVTCHTSHSSEDKKENKTREVAKVIFKEVLEKISKVEKHSINGQDLDEKLTHYQNQIFDLLKSVCETNNNGHYGAMYMINDLIPNCVYCATRYLFIKSAYDSDDNIKFDTSDLKYLDDTVFYIIRDSVDSIVFDVDASFRQIFNFIGEIESTKYTYDNDMVTNDLVENHISHSIDILKNQKIFCRDLINNIAEILEANIDTSFVIKYLDYVFDLLFTFLSTGALAIKEV